MIYCCVIKHGDGKRWVMLHHGGDECFYVGCYRNLSTMLGRFFEHNLDRHFELKKGFCQFILFCLGFLAVSGEKQA